MLTTAIRYTIVSAIVFITHVSYSQLPPVIFMDNSTYLMGYKDPRTREIVIPATYELAGQFANAESGSPLLKLAAVKLNDKYGYIDVKGKTVVPIIYEDCKNFNAAMAAVKKAGKWGFIDSKGKMVIPAKFDDAGFFRYPDRMAPVKVGETWGFIDQTGAFKIQPTYIEAKDFHNGIAAVKTPDGWGYINFRGNMEIQPSFYFADDFELSDTAAVATNDRIFLINRKGEEVKGSGNEYAPSQIKLRAATNNVNSLKKEELNRSMPLQSLFFTRKFGYPKGTMEKDKKAQEVWNTYLDFTKSAGQEYTVFNNAWMELMKDGIDSVAIVKNRSKGQPALYEEYQRLRYYFDEWDKKWGSLQLNPGENSLADAILLLLKEQKSLRGEVWNLLSYMVTKNGWSSYSEGLKNLETTLAAVKLAQQKVFSASELYVRNNKLAQ